MVIERMGTSVASQCCYLNTYLRYLNSYYLNWGLNERVFQHFFHAPQSAVNAMKCAEKGDGSGRRYVENAFSREDISGRYDSICGELV